MSVTKFFDATRILIVDGKEQIQEIRQIFAPSARIAMARFRRLVGTLRPDNEVLKITPSSRKFE